MTVFFHSYFGQISKNDVHHHTELRTLCKQDFLLARKDDTFNFEVYCFAPSYHSWNQFSLHFSASHASVPRNNNWMQRKLFIFLNAASRHHNLSYKNRNKVSQSYRSMIQNSLNVNDHGLFSFFPTLNRKYTHCISTYSEWYKGQGAFTRRTISIIVHDIMKIAQRTTANFKWYRNHGKP